MRGPVVVLAALAALVVACGTPSRTSDTEGASGPGGTSSGSSGTSGTTTAGAGTSEVSGASMSGSTTMQVPTTGESGTTTTTGSPGTTTAETTSDDSTTGGEPPGPRYDEVRQKSAHNSFQRDESLLDQMIYHRVRSIEFDIHVGKTLESAVSGDWFVYHTDVVDDDTSCERLSHCLDQVAALVRAVPDHEVVTVWIDLKDGFGEGHGPAELDARLTAAFGEQLVRPAELMAACPGAATLREAVTAPECGWPRLSTLRGRVIAALTGGGLGPGSTLANYVGADATARAAFVAPDLTDASQLREYPEAIVHNLEIGDVALAGAVRSAGQVSRVWVADDADAWAAAEEAQVHHIATNKVSALVDAWSTTAGPGGWPFTCFSECEAPAMESGAIATVTVESQDLWDSSDDGLLATFAAADGALTVTAAIATPSSHVEPWAKACLAARASTAADAPYLAVCRPADNHPLRVQVRAAAGEATEAFEIAGFDGLTTEVPAFVRLVRDADNLCVRGLGSADAVGWTPIAEHCFAAPMTTVGVMAASHGGGTVRLMFAELLASPGGPIAAADLTPVPLGAGVGAVMDGP